MPIALSLPHFAALNAGYALPYDSANFANSFTSRS